LESASIDAAGELYLSSKGDGVIRKVVGATGQQLANWRIGELVNW